MYYSKGGHMTHTATEQHVVLQDYREASVYVIEKLLATKTEKTTVLFPRPRVP